MFHISLLARYTNHTNDIALKQVYSWNREYTYNVCITELLDVFIKAVMEMVNESLPQGILPDIHKNANLIKSSDVRQKRKVRSMFSENRFLR